MDEALAAFDSERIPWERMTGRAMTFARTHRTSEARAEVAAMRESLGDAASYQYAQIYTLLGEPDEAFRWFASARRVHDPGLMGQVLPDPVLDPLRSDPRYAALIRELGFESTP